VQSVTDIDIECVDITKYYGERLVIDRLNLEIGKGEFFSLLGPSGSGKSTVLRMIAGFEPISEGTLRLRGEVANEIPPHRRGVGLVFQHLALFPHLSVGENVAFGLRMKRLEESEIWNRVAAALHLMHLEGYEPRRTNQLSGGERQRVALARALVTEPTVLLLDEPLTGLDYKLSIELKNEFKRIHEQTGTTFVYVTHDQTSALGISQRMAVLNKGKIEQLGEPTEIYRRPRTRFVADFIGSANILNGRYTGDGSFEAAGFAMRVADVSRSGEGWVSIRPERIRIGVASAGDNVVDGVVTNFVYQGSNYLITARVDETRLVVMAEHFRGKGGDRVQLSWKPEDVIPLTD
jgi:ABC-type Fe3+/spermidine/putrescine transport system ATPase subunit